MINSYVVGIGASAGGLEVLQQFFSKVESDTSFAFVVIQHLSSDHESMMDELLGRHTSMPITVVEKLVTLEPNHIYLISPRHNLLVEKDLLRPTPKAQSSDLNLPIDTFFHSLAQTYRERAIGIVLSGTGSDGSRGVKTIREEGGIVIVQDPATAKFDGMPSATQAAGADMCLEMPLIPKEINRLAHDIPGQTVDFDDETLTDDRILLGILTLVYNKTGNDFRQHRTPTLLRRIDKRARIVDQKGMQAYHQYLRNHPDEVELLSEEFSIAVSCFFRDKHVWDTFAETVVPQLFKSKEEGETIRVWVPGCSTSEEAYTIAILLSDYQSRHQYVDFKIFATDIDKKALARAGSGTFPLSIMHDVESRWMERYFKQIPTGFKVNKNIREKVVFAVHNLVSDPPFIRMDLISCRNTLIYIKPKVQQRILKNFHYSLLHQGFLILGSNENLGEVAQAFQGIANTNIFRSTQKKKFDRLSSNLVMPTGHPVAAAHQPAPRKPAASSKGYLSDHYAALLLEEHAPVAVFTDTDANILYINGDVAPFLQFPQKQAQLNLLNMVGKEQRPLIRTGIQKAQQEDTDINFEAISFGQDENTSPYDVRFKEVWQEHLEKNIILVEFTQSDAVADQKSIVIQQGNLASDQIEALEREVQQKNHELQSLTEQLETSNEELQASNEELQASNEELQSSNEELQSVNEELYTVNAELKAKINEVISYSNDISNLLTSTDIATVFLDQELNIRSVTPNVAEVVDIGSRDVGRPFRNLNTDLKRNYLVKDVQKVRSDGKAVRREVETRSGRYYYNQVLPYRRSDGQTDGVVITFVDITEVKKARRARRSAEKKIKDTRTRLELVIESMKVGVWEWIPLTQRMEWNMHMLELYDMDAKEFDHSMKTSLIRIHPEDRDQVADAILHTVATEEELDMEYRVVWRDDSVHHIYTQGRTIKDHKTKEPRLVGTCVDLTQRKSAEEEALQYGRLLENSHNEIYICDARTLRFITVNQGAQENLGYSLSDMRSLTLLDITAELSRKQFQTLTYSLDEDSEDNVQFETVHQRKDGTHYPVLSDLQATRYRDQEVFVLIVQDITEQALSTARLKETNRQLKIANEYLDNFVFTAAHDLRSPVANLISLTQLLQEADSNQYPTIIEKISTSVFRLESTLSGLIKILNIQQFGQDESREVSFHQTLRLISEELEQQIKEADAQIDADFEVPMICYVPPYLDSITRNLLSNAIKYRSADRPLRVTLRTVPADRFVKLQFSDNGIGIDLKRFKDRLFKPFERLTRQANGKGIGMHLIKTMVERNGGYLEVESQLGQGTTFTVYLKSYDSEQPKTVSARRADRR